MYSYKFYFSDLNNKVHIYRQQGTCSMQKAICDQLEKDGLKVDPFHNCFLSINIKFTFSKPYVETPNVSAASRCVYQWLSDYSVTLRLRSRDPPDPPPTCFMSL